MTQKERILDVLLAVKIRQHNIPEEFMRRHPSGDGVSARYFKQVMLISECNGRISEPCGQGHNVETSKAKDHYGFVYHRLGSNVMTAAEMLDWFDNDLPPLIKAQPH